MQNISFKEAPWSIDSPIATIIIDRSGEILMFNEAASLLLSVPQRSALGANLNELLFESKDMVNRHMSYIEFVFDNGVRGIQKMGKKRRLPYNGRLLDIKLNLFDKDNTAYCAAFIIDETDLALAEKKISELEDEVKKAKSIQMVVNRTTDVRLRIIQYLFGTVVGLVLFLGIMSLQNRDNPATKTIEVLLAGIVGSMTSSVSFYFQSDESKKEKTQ